MTSLGMHRGLHGGSDGAEIRCHWEQLDGLFHHLPQSQSGPTQSEGSAQMSEEIISGGTYPTAHRPPPHPTVGLLQSGSGDPVPKRQQRTGLGSTTL